MKKLILMMLMMLYSISVVAQNHFIVIGKEENQTSANVLFDKCQNIIQKENLEKATVRKSNFENYYLIQVGPFAQNETLAVSFFTLKKYFPYAFVINESANLNQKTSALKIQEQKPLVITKEVLVEKEDSSLWIALFGLAIIGILYMFLSSDQIRRIKDSQRQMKEKYKILEEKQHRVLSSMGENIHTIAQETINHTNKLVEKSRETALHDEIKQVMHNEHELLDVTDDLIKFLRLKSKKVVVQNEIFNLNNVLNEVIGSLHEIASKKRAELIFDIGKSVPQYILADSSHLGQIFVNLLEYYLQQSKDARVYFSVEVLAGFAEQMRLKCKIMGDVTIEDKENLFDAHYDDANRRYIGLGLFVAKELIELMEGEIVIQTYGGRDIFEIILPIEEASKDKRQYRLPKKEIMQKHALIIEKSYKEAKVLQNRFTYFKIDAAIEKASYLIQEEASLYKYDFIVIDRDLLTQKIIDIFKTIEREKSTPQIVIIENLYKHYSKKNTGTWVKTTIQKPFSPSHIFETLIDLFDPNAKVQTLQYQEKGNKELPIHRKNFEFEPDMSLEKFNKFSGKGLLLVEDNLINQKVIEGVLSKSDMNIYIANNGAEALDILKEKKQEIDIVLMDINMPVMDGYVCTKSIREESCYAQIPIIALTALVAEHEISKMFDLGMNGYLSKPLKVEQLYTAMKIFLGESNSKKHTEKEKNNIPDSLPGLNIQAGMINMQENQIFYREVLKEFMDAYADSDSTLEMYIAEKRYGQARILCLDMKGLTETIGAEEMFNVVSEIHKYLTLYHHIDHADNYIGKYRKKLEELKSSIRIYLSR